MKKKILSGVLALCLVFGSAAAMPQGVFDDVTSIGVSAVNSKSAKDITKLTPSEFKQFLNSTDSIRRAIVHYNDPNDLDSYPGTLSVNGKGKYLEANQIPLGAELTMTPNKSLIPAGKVVCWKIDINMMINQPSDDLEYVQVFVDCPRVYKSEKFDIPDFAIEDLMKTAEKYKIDLNTFDWKKLELDFNIYAEYEVCEHYNATCVDGKAATCTEAGNECYYYCSICQKYFADWECKNVIPKDSWIIPATGHKFGEWETTSFDIEKGTLTQYRMCENCYTSENRTINDAIVRFKGSGRYATAAAISKGAYPDKADTVVLANGTKFADALAGATLAHVNGAPILLTEANSLPADTLAEIKRLKAKNVIILGGSASVGQEVKDKLAENNLDVKIVKGKTKYATAVEIAKATQAKTEQDPTEIFFVSADKFADALSVSAVAAKKNAPIIYLPKTGSIDADTAAYLKSVKGKIKNAYVIGGSGVIGADVMAAAGKALGLTVDKNIVRVKGKTKYDTCVEVNTKFADVLNGTAICVATGEDFPDALAGGVFAAKNTAPLFLASGSLSENQKSYLKTKKAENIFVFGGSKSVPNDLVQSIATASL